MSTATCCGFRRRSWTAVDTGLGLPDAGATWATVLAGLDAPVDAVRDHALPPGPRRRGRRPRRADRRPGPPGCPRLRAVPRTSGRRDREPRCRTRTSSCTGRPRTRWRPSGGEPCVRCSGSPFRARPRVARPGPATRSTAGRCSTSPGTRTATRLPSPGRRARRRRHAARVDLAEHRAVPGPRPDPLGDYFDSLGRIVALAPRVALTGHGEPSRTRRAGPGDDRPPRRPARPPEAALDAAAAPPTRSRGRCSRTSFRRPCAASRSPSRSPTWSGSSWRSAGPRRRRRAHDLREEDLSPACGRELDALRVDELRRTGRQAAAPVSTRPWARRSPGCAAREKIDVQVGREEALVVLEQLHSRRPSPCRAASRPAAVHDVAVLVAEAVVLDRVPLDRDAAGLPADVR